MGLEPRQHPRRTLLNAMFYQLRAGQGADGAWRVLSQEWPP